MTETLLAGPILRRATPNRVCVWFATRTRVALTLQITTKEGQVLGKSAKLTDNDYCQLGKNLFVYLLQARCKKGQSYPTDKDNTFLYYQLLDSKGNALDLSTLRLTYDNEPHPKFYIPTEIKQLLHGSCRKPHGGGHSLDALSYASELLQKTHDNIKQRPNLLLLTGDQIYADDVSISVLAMLKDKAEDLLGKDETIPVTDQTSQTLKDIPLHSRKDFLNAHNSGFTSSESENHLLGFGEFAAMYIYVFGNAENWQVSDDWSALREKLPEKVRGHSEELAKVHTIFEEQKNAVAIFQKTLPQVRKLLANIPTYMIFDDHDVTDDWNITNVWYDDVSDSALGRRVVSNALAAYWAFQGWGNNPDNFNPDLPKNISQHLLDEKNDSDITARYDLYTWSHRGWGFSIATQPPIIAIDSRTQRMQTFNSYLPVLLDHYASSWLQIEWEKLKTTSGLTVTADTCPIFIATTPVLGFTPIETVQKLLYWFAKLIEKSKIIKTIEKLFNKKGYCVKKIINHVDMEAWTSNKNSFSGLMNCLSRDMKIKQCLFLSGDVHYAFSALGKYSYIHNNRQEELNCYQLVSSSLKNKPDDKQEKFLERLSKFKDNQFTKHTSSMWQSLFPWLLKDGDWENRIYLLPAKDGITRVSADCNLGLVKLKNGKPIQHVLMDNPHIIYDLPDCHTHIYLSDNEQSDVNITDKN